MSLDPKLAARAVAAAGDKPAVVLLPARNVP
jgi:hypothetical protein